MTAPVPSRPVNEIDTSCRLPLLVLFVSAGLWLVIGSAFGLIASLKFHSPNFLADCPWLTYGRVRPACTDSLLYGFCIQAGLGVTLWLFARMGNTKLSQPLLVVVGAKLWNLGVTVGILGILAGDATGFETLEMPRYAAIILFLGYLVIAIWGVVTFHQRSKQILFAPQWFLLAALFWFPWIYSTATLLLLTFPVRGVAQAVITWWFANNLQVVWLGLVGLGTVFYFVPALTNRVLYSRYLALFAFWILILFGSWGGIPNSAPVPAWMPTISTVASVLSLFCVVSVAMNIYGTLEGKCSQLQAHTSLLFIGFGLISFIVANLMMASGSMIQASRIVNLTWFTPAQNQLQVYGFFGMIMLGAIYYILPQLIGMEFPWPKLVRMHFWSAAIGVVLIVVPLALGGIVQGLKFQDPNVPFIDIAKSTLNFLRASTLGELAIAFGHGIFLVNVVGMVNRFYRARALSAFAAATATLPTAEVRA